MIALALALCAASGTDCVQTDERGRSFATCFDPGNGVELGATLAAREGRRPTASVQAAVRVRTERISVSKEGSLWFNEHRLLETRAQPDAAEKMLAVTAYQAVFRRHLAEGFVLVPTAAPIRLPFPFDVAISLSVGRYERRVYEGSGYTFESGRAALLLDPLRSATGRAHLAFGPALSHTLRVDTDVVQELAPLTSASIDWGYESADGLWSLRLVGLAGIFYVPGRESNFRARAELTAERVVLALNDQPISLVAHGGYAWREAGVSAHSEWSFGLGLSFRPLTWK